MKREIKMKKIQRIGYFFKLLFQIIFIALPILSAICWWRAPAGINLFNHSVVINFVPKNWPIMHHLSVTTKALGFLINLIPVGIAMLALYFLIRLFRLYERGTIFTIQNVRYLRNIGYTLLIGQLLSPIYDMLISLVLTWSNPHHYRMIGITEKGINVEMILVALLVILISWIMLEGYKLKEEQELTV